MSRSPHISILLASYNGAAFLPEQLSSFAAQDYNNWSLLVSDDLSRDNTRALLAGFAASRPDGQVQILDGPCQGATRNFLSLLQRAPDGVYLALSDQDDVWLPGKLSRAIEVLSQKDGPVLYCARTIICNEDLDNQKPSRPFGRPHAFRNALVQACTAGNTCVLNPAAAEIAKAGLAAAGNADIVSHDWWLYQLISGAGGKVIWDERPALLYRQHGSNEMGRNDTPLAAIKRVAMLMGGHYRDWLGTNIRALRGAEALLTPENLSILTEYEAALNASGPEAARRMRRIGLYRQDRLSMAALYLAAFLGRLRQD